MTYLVTGVAGFIGSQVSVRLLELGHQVVGVDNESTSADRWLIDARLGAQRSFEGFQYRFVNLANETDVLRLFSQPIDGVLHLAASPSVRQSVKEPLPYIANNVTATLALLEGIRRNGCLPTILASTGSVYGASTPVPFSESAAANEPLAPYPASKRSMELFAYSHASLYGIPTTVARLFNVYGPFGRPDMMPWKWATAIAHGEPITLFDDGRLRRDWTYVDDVVDGIISLLSLKSSFEIVNLGLGRPVENLEFVRILEHLVGREALILHSPAPKSEPFETFANIKKAGSLCDYRPQVDTREGLEKFVGWLRAAGRL